MIRRGDVVRFATPDEIKEMGVIPSHDYRNRFSDFAPDDTLYPVQYINNRYSRVSLDSLYYETFAYTDLVKVRETEIPTYEVGDRIILPAGHPDHQAGFVVTVTRVDERNMYSFYDDPIEDYEKCVENELVRPYYDGYDAPTTYRKRCIRCGSYYTADLNEHVHKEDRSLCDTCRARKYVTPYHHYNPHIDFFSTQEDDDLYMGIELEIDNGGEKDSVAARVVDHLTVDGKMFAYCSHDGSLDNGFEIITMPATRGYHKLMKPNYESLFNYLVSIGYRSHNTQTAGIHVHFSRKFFENDEEANISKLLYLVEKFWDEIVVFSRRDYRSIERYAKKMDVDAKRFFSSWNKSNDHDGHYYAVNITNTDTIELRMFRGTLNIETFMAIIDFVDKIARVSKNTPVSEIQDVEFEDLLTEQAKEYYHSRMNFCKFDEGVSGESNTSNTVDCIYTF